MGKFTGLLGGMGSFLGGAAVEGSAEEQEKQIDKLLQQAMDENGNIDPNVLQKLVAEQQQGSAFDQINIDPRMRDAQTAALMKLQRESDEGGMTLEDRAALNDVNNDVNQQDKARRDAMMTHMQARGAGGSGVELAAQLASAQSSAQSAADQGFKVHAEARRRALQAAQQSGSLGTAIRDQDWAEAAARASAKDRINAYNAQLRQQMSLANNQNQQMNFNNRLSLQDRKNKIRGSQADRYQDQANRTRRQGEASGRAVGTFLGGAADIGTGIATGGASTLLPDDEEE